MSIVSCGYVLDKFISTTNCSLMLDNYSIPLTCSLIQADVEKKYSKFFVIHALLLNSEFVLYTRHGKVGSDGSIKMQKYKTKDNLVKAFLNMFKKLTANSWLYRDKFELRKDHYGVYNYGTLTEHDFVKFDRDFNVDISLKPIFDIFDPKNTQHLIKSSLIDLDIDTEIMPLGMMKKSNLDKALDILKELSLLLPSYDENYKEIKHLSDKYYCYIPTFIKKTIIIDSLERIKNCYNIIDTLDKILYSYEFIDKVKSITSFKNIIDHDVELLTKDNPEYYLINNYINNSIIHTQFTKFKNIEIFKINNEERNERFYSKYRDIKREFLFHGSFQCNWISILNRGLLLKSGVSRNAGGMFGSGIYWANVCSKSMQYCDIKNNKLCLVIGEVAVGNEFQVKKGGDYSKLDKKYNSVWGLGKNTYSRYTTIDDVFIANSKLVFDKKNIDKDLYYDEKIIYDEHQYTFRYFIIINI